MSYPAVGVSKSASILAAGAICQLLQERFGVWVHCDPNGIEVEVAEAIATENVSEDFPGFDGGTNRGSTIGQHEYGFKVIVECK